MLWYLHMWAHTIWHISYIHIWVGLALNSSLKRFRRRLVRHLTAVETDTALDIFSPATLQCRPPLGSVLVPLRYTPSHDHHHHHPPTWNCPWITHTRCCSRGITCLWVCFCTQISSVSRKPDKGWTTARHGLCSVISIYIYSIYRYIVLGCSCCSAVSSSASFVVCSVDKLDLSLFSFVLQLAKFVCINKVHCTDVCKSLNTPGHVTATYL